MAVHGDLDDAPLDPAAERLRRKLVRLLFVSGGIMVLGLIAVFAAIVYKIGERDRAGTPADFSAEASIEARVQLAPGQRLLSASLDGDRALLQVETADGATWLLLVDLASGAIVGRYAVKAE
jgi:hypothetical protein